MDATPRVVAGLNRVKGLFLESPTSRFSVAHAATSSGLSEDLCVAILMALEDVRLIKRDVDGYYCCSMGADGAD
jgi:hypothetical protein